MQKTKNTQIDEEIKKRTAALREELKAKSLDGGIQPVLTKYSDIDPEKLEWLWQNRIPMGKLTLLVGDPGLGKSMLTLDIAAHVSTGTPWPDLPGSKVEAGSVITLTAEDDLADTVRIRLEAAEANLERVITISAVEEKGEKQRDLYNLTKDFEVLVKAMEQTSDTRLVIIDPISAYMGSKNSNSNTEVREFLAPLAKLAAESGAAIVGISHLNKNPTVPAIYRTLGSIGFMAAARAVWMVAKEDEDEDLRLLLPKKGNLFKNPTGLAFRLDDVEVQTKDGPVTTARCRFEEGEVRKTADDILMAEIKNQRGPKRREEATDWLKGVLSSGSKPANEVYDQAKRDRIMKRTLDRAKKELGVKSDWIESGGKRISVWSLPNQKSKIAKES